MTWRNEQSVIVAGTQPVLVDLDDHTVWICIPGYVRIDATVALIDAPEVQAVLQQEDVA